MTKLGATVLGVSTDTVESHVKFRDKYKLNFPLLADTEHKVAEKYGAWREKTRFGKTSMGIQRSTFIIDSKGVVRKMWKSVKVEGHDEQVLKGTGGNDERGMRKAERTDGMKKSEVRPCCGYGGSSHGYGRKE